jgi:hypothetical protein
MFRLAMMCCAIAAFTVAGPLPAMAAFGDTTSYATIDAIEVVASNITVTGIISGQGTPTTTTYPVTGGTESAARCDRLALLAMAKPGKYQFAVVDQGLGGEVSCKLIVRTP